MGEMKGRCVILAAGKVETPELLRPLLRRDDWIVAADGGMRLAAALRVRPSLLVADFDSLDESSVPEGTAVCRLPVRKDSTDTLAAAVEGLHRGYRDFLLLGGTGGRLDHTLANLCVLLYLKKQGASAVLADERNRVEIWLPGSHRVEPVAGYKFSLIPFGGEVEGLTMINAAYPLQDARLTPDDPLGVSNEFTEVPVEISFSRGNLLFFLSKD